MAWQQLQSIGKGNGNPLSILNSIDVAKKAGNNGVFAWSFQDIELTFLKYGKDMTSIFESASQGQNVTLFTLKDDSYLSFYVQTKRNNTMSGGTYKKDEILIFLRHYNKAGTKLREFGGGWIVYKLYDGSGAFLRYYPCYLSFAMDSDSNLANCKLLGAYDNGSKTSCPLWDFNLLGTQSQGTLYNTITGSGEYYDPNPWANAGYADVGGGDGIFNFEGDIIGLPPIPTVDAVSSGFLQLFTDDLSKIRDLSAYMWSNNFLETLVKITDNPLSIIMGLYMYPFDIPKGNRKQVKAGSVLTPVYMGVPQGQIFEIDCGDFPVPSFYGAYLDFEPFSKCEIFLPYCGTFTVSLDDVSGKTVNVKYRVDLLTGACVAYLIVDGTVKYNFTGMCAINIPISSRSFETTYSAIINSATAIFSRGALSSVGTVGNVASGVMQSKPSISHGGNASANSGYLGVQKPYFIFTVPRVAIPKQQNKYIGYPIYATYALSELSGYTEVEKVHLENMGQATKNEIDKIISLLEGGVIL